MQNRPNPNRNRRVTDKLDPAVQLATMQERVNHISNTLDDVKTQMARVVDRVGDVATVRELAAQDRTTMGRIERSLQELGESLADRLDEAQQAQQARWDAHAAVHRAVDKKLNTAVGWVTGVGAVAGLLVGMTVWVLDFRFQELSREAAAVQPMRERVHQLELHLARDRGAVFPQPEKP